MQPQFNENSFECSYDNFNKFQHDALCALIVSHRKSTLRSICGEDVMVCRASEEKRGLFTVATFSSDMLDDCVTLVEYSGKNDNIEKIHSSVKFIIRPDDMEVITQSINVAGKTCDMRQNNNTIKQYAVNRWLLDLLNTYGQCEESVELECSDYFSVKHFA